MGALVFLSHRYASHHQPWILYHDLLGVQGMEASRGPGTTSSCPNPRSQHRTWLPALMGPVLSPSFAVQRWLLIFLWFFLPLSSTSDMLAKGGFMEDGMWEELSQIVRWIHRGECTKCLMQEDSVQQSCKGGKSIVYSQSLKKSHYLPPLWPLSSNHIFHSPWTRTWTWLYIRQIALGDKGNISSYWRKVRASAWDHPVGFTTHPRQGAAAAPGRTHVCSAGLYPKRSPKTSQSIWKGPVVLGKCLSGHWDLPPSESLSTI